MTQIVDFKTLFMLEIDYINFYDIMFPKISIRDTQAKKN